MRKAGVARAMTATRRLAAIMAVDVVGYSRLMGEDEAGTASAVREHRDAVRPVNAGAPHIPLAVIANWGAPQPVAEGG